VEYKNFSLQVKMPNTKSGIRALTLRIVNIRNMFLWFENPSRYLNQRNPWHRVFERFRIS
jgi:hypothetical protein